MIRFRLSEVRVVVQSLVIALIVTTTFISSCTTAYQKAPGAPSAAMPAVESQERRAGNKDTLYLALGGNNGIENLTTEFIKELAADDRVRPHYKNTDIGRFHTMMKLYVCELAEGPCIYTGDDMKRTHGGMNIKSSEFNAVVEALMRAMDTVELNPGVQNRLLAIFAPMRPDVVGQ